MNKLIDIIRKYQDITNDAELETNITFNLNPTMFDGVDYFSIKIKTKFGEEFEYESFTIDDLTRVMENKIQSIIDLR
ncbi:MAG: hypothetical protein LC122_13420 [Chitinophagales bacterium]|nr:hypothetical protein [Chitinophagales bacterium]